MFWERKMKGSKSDTIRETFLRFFEDKGHKRVASHSLIPPKDPTLLFVNAGMVQFKDAFTGERELGFRRACSAQKCLRVSGKHNDLEQVGFTSRHHTFFEMLGNFSFGDYFKRDAIRFAWELLVDVYGLDRESLWVTVHNEDDEAKAIWLEEIGVPKERVVEDKTNFWAMGDTGPCGPCSEIHIDRGEGYAGKDLLNEPGERFMELWNLVFMQFERAEDGALKPLPKPCIDTGMGLERIACVLQGVRTNFDTDLFRPLILKGAEVARVRSGTDPRVDAALRIIADHARATAFLIADGVYPENEGRGYVLRRLMRRALRYGYSLGVRDVFFVKVCDEVANIMGGAFPELGRTKGVMEEVVSQEEERFLRTLHSGMTLLEEAIAKTKANREHLVDGNTVFLLYDTHGFPTDLTASVAKEHGLEIDLAGFEREMEMQRQRGRASWKTDDDVLLKILEAHENLKTASVGYETLEAKGKVQLLLRQSEVVDQLCAPEEGVIVADVTPFYGESGGQVGDTGVIEGDGFSAIVTDTKKWRQDVVLHLVKVVKGKVKPGDEVYLKVDKEKRDATRRHHSATHLLHLALRRILGEHVRQRGSFVEPTRLRFDFSHTRALNEQEIAGVERLVLEWVLADFPVKTEVMPFDRALQSGAMHFFEDKYGDVVRVVMMGESKELCGGTHCSRTGEIGLVKITEEGSVSAGVRRIEAVAGLSALDYVQENERLIQNLCNEMRSDRKALLQRARKALERQKELEKEVSELKVLAKAGGRREYPRHKAGEHEVIVVSGDGLDTKALRNLADQVRESAGNGYVLITKSDGNALTVVLACNKELGAKRPCGALLKTVLEKFGGKGGGSQTLAQGGVEGAGSEEILDELLRSLRK
jgi:alanyl-tRNA synthetase